MNKEQEECSHTRTQETERPGNVYREGLGNLATDYQRGIMTAFTEETERPNTQNYRGGGPDTASAKQLSNAGTVEFMGQGSAFVEAGLDGEYYTGATRWQHVAEEAQESGEKVRDVREGAWEGTQRPDYRSNDEKPGDKQLTVGGSVGRDNPTSSAVCTLCGAWWGSLGLEPLADCKRLNGGICASCYTCHSVLILRALRGVLADDGVVFWNVADSYHAGRSGGHPGGSNQWKGETNKYPLQSGMNDPALKPKDLAGIPGRVVQALQEDGWWRRSDIVWVKGASFAKKGVRELLKPYREKIEEGVFEELAQHLEKNAYIGNSMPESTKDRPTRGYEMIYMLTKKAHYYTDMDAVREKHTDESLARYGRNSGVDGSQPYAMKQGPRGHGAGKVFPQETAGAGSGVRGHSGYFSADGKLLVDPDAGRNARNVWLFPTSGFGWQLCTLCGTVYDQKEYKALEKVQRKLSWKEKAEADAGPVDEYPNHQDGGDTGLMAEKGMVNLGVCKTCGSSDGWGSHFSSFPMALPEHAILMGSPKDGIVLDPFAGTGTTLLAALKHGRKGIGFELSGDYSKIAAERLRREVEKKENGMV